VFKKTTLFSSIDCYPAKIMLKVITKRYHILLVQSDEMTLDININYIF